MKYSHHTVPPKNGSHTKGIIYESLFLYTSYFFINHIINARPCHMLSAAKLSAHSRIFLSFFFYVSGNPVAITRGNFAARKIETITRFVRCAVSS